ncbi:MAG: hypothetical protein JWN41_587 [Thermoleophilia bacterium]|nr:hypothetical protein [Thermoleophilia bacterium]
MSLYQITENGLQPHRAGTLAELGLKERGDMQRLLREDISVIGTDLLVIAEEFGEWQDANRRIDLLAIDRSGRMAVIELKRTADGGHMELQALRYAAMISSMSYADVLTAFRSHCARYRPDVEDPQALLTAHLDVDLTEDDEPAISTDVRIVLVSSGFGREITSAVLWLNGFEGMDIRCFRMVAYDIEGTTLLDVRQIIPLPEAADYQVRLRRKDAARERARTQSTRDHTKYQLILDGVPGEVLNKRKTIRAMVRELVERGMDIGALRSALPKPSAREVPGILDTEGVLDAFEVEGRDAGRWYTDMPLHDHANNVTYVMKNQWGTDTERTLTSLVDRFPNSGVSYQQADDA